MLVTAHSRFLDSIPPSSVTAHSRFLDSIPRSSVTAQSRFVTVSHLTLSLPRFHSTKLPSFCRFRCASTKKSSATKMNSTKGKMRPLKNEVISFCSGSLVEVTTDEDGYKGAWFEAKIVTQLSPPVGRSRKRKKGGSFVVEYLKLVEENGSRPLTETVAGKQLRPFPPVLNDPFELHDVVDAFLNDGWWEGSVVEVVDEPKRFSVFFETPSPHVMEFNRDELRHHLNWDGYKWFRSCKKTYNSYDHNDQMQNQQATPPNTAISLEVVLSGENFMSSEITGEDGSTLLKELEVSKGHGSEIAQVKVNSTRTELFYRSEGGITLSHGCKKMKTRGTYTPPTELPSDIRPCIMFKESVLGNIFQNASVAQQSRPATCFKIVDLSPRDEDITAVNNDVTPQHPSNTSIHPGQERIANFSSWEAFSRKGDHDAFRTKALEASQKDAVTYERKRKMMSSPISSFDSNLPADMNELDQPDISNDLGSLHSTDEAAGTSVGSTMQVQASTLDEITYPATVCISDGQRQKASAVFPNTSSTLNVFSPQGSSIFATNTRVDSSFQKEYEDSYSNSQMEPYMVNSTCTDLTVISKTDVRPFSLNKLLSGNIYTPLLYIKPSSIVLPYETRALFAEIFQNQIEVRHGPLMIVEKPPSSDVSSERCDEIAKKSIDIVDYCGKEKRSFLSLKNTPLEALPSSQNSSGLELLDTSQEGYSTKDGTPDMTVTTCYSGSNPPPSSDILELDLPDIITDPWFPQQRDEVAGSVVYTSEQTLPFHKKSPLWENIELMKAFQAFPQNPHFRPLKHYSDSHCEGMAIACTVIFASLVDEMLQLIADVPKSNIDKIMKDIVPFENLGFNIAPIKDCLKKLQRVKEEREQLLQASVEAKHKIEEKARVVEETSTKLENAVNELRILEEKVAKLKKDVANLHATKEEQIFEMTAQRSKYESIEQGILQTETDFRNILSNRHLTAAVSDFAVN